MASVFIVNSTWAHSILGVLNLGMRFEAFGHEVDFSPHRPSFFTVFGDRGHAVNGLTGPTVSSDVFAWSDAIQPR